MSQIDTLREMIASSHSIVFLGGAGVSTESGIPDFRSESGLYSAVSEFGYPPETIISHTFFLKKPEMFYEYYKKNLIATDALPNAAHKGLALMERLGKIKAVITQNIDGLHQKAGSKSVYELHGSVWRNTCMKCGKKHSLESVVNSVGVPRCECGGMIKPDVVLYEEGLDENVLGGAINAITRADMMIVGGTSLTVYPAAGLINYYSGSRLALINKSATSYDNNADLVINDAIGKVFLELYPQLLED